MMPLYMLTNYSTTHWIVPVGSVKLKGLFFLGLLVLVCHQNKLCPPWQQHIFPVTQMSPVSSFMFTFLSALYCQMAFASWYHFLNFLLSFCTFPEFLPCVHSWRERNSSELLEESWQVDATIYLMSSQAGGPLMPWNVTLPDRSAWQFHSVGFLMSLQVINCHCWFDDDYVNCGHCDSSPTLPFHSFENMVWACTVLRELNTRNLVSLTQCQQFRPLKQTSA